MKPRRIDVKDTIAGRNLYLMDSPTALTHTNNTLHNYTLNMQMYVMWYVMTPNLISPSSIGYAEQHLS